MGNTSIAGCSATYPSFLSFSPVGGDPDAFASDVSCLAVAGTGGCGFEQQLDAALKAVTPSTSSITFGGGDGMGHADRSNAGFLRPDSVLAIVMVTDEEDCSAADPEIFNPPSTVYTGDLNLRCFMYPDARHPISRYTEGFLAAKEAARLVVMNIVGIPPGAEGLGYDDILAHSNMVEMIDPDMPTRLAPSCNVTGRGFAFPPVRFVELAKELDARGVAAPVHTICQADLTLAVRDLAVNILERLRGTCT
jgi:hypothetical protein